MFGNRMILTGICCLCGVVLAWAEKPQTAAGVVRPQTQSKQTKPQSLPGKGKPQTTVLLQRPVTQVPVLKPVTLDTSASLQTRVEVARPQTAVVVNHPTSTPVEVNDLASSSSSSSSSSKAAKKSNTIPSSSSPTTMSGFQMPQAKDFKAASLGAGENGLGNPNDAEKSAAAASFKLPQAEAASADNLKSMMDKVQSFNPSSLEKQLTNNVKK